MYSTTPIQINALAQTLNTTSLTVVLAKTHEMFLNQMPDQEKQEIVNLGFDIIAKLRSWSSFMHSHNRAIKTKERPAPLLPNLVDLIRDIQLTILSIMLGVLTHNEWITLHRLMKEQMIDTLPRVENLWTDDCEV